MSSAAGGDNPVVVEELFSAPSLSGGPIRFVVLRDHGCAIVQGDTVLSKWADDDAGVRGALDEFLRLTRPATVLSTGMSGPIQATKR